MVDLSLDAGLYTRRPQTATSIWTDAQSKALSINLKLYRVPGRRAALVTTLKCQNSKDGTNHPVNLDLGF